MPTGSLKKIPVQGGAALTLVDSMGDGLGGFAVQGASWGPDDTIVFAALNPSANGVWRVAAGGGTPERVTTLREGELHHAWPQILPGGRRVLYTIWSNTGFDGGRLAVQPLDGGEPTVLVERASYGRVVSDDDSRRAWLVYARPDGLHAAPFDPDGARMAGAAVPVLDGLLVNLSGGAHFSVSASGLLAYVPGGLDEANKTALWVARDGSSTDLGVIPGLGFQYRLSPDGRRLVRPNAIGPNRDLWVDDLDERGTPTRLTIGRVNNVPIWTPDGRRIIYSSGVPNGNLFWRAADGTGGEERLTTSVNRQVPGAVSPDGATLAYVEGSDDRSTDIWLLPLRATREPRLLVGTPVGESAPRFSPDGRWLAYQSNISGQFEIYLASVTGGTTGGSCSTAGSIRRRAAT